ncbi:type VII secretion protein EccE [Streptomyces sp. NPDC088864]|uniref:type VII secretion protein EccE n=1 Tax=Streptomyces sp. NPDC088864 TaxID=3365910 RepID=UPI003807930D
MRLHQLVLLEAAGALLLVTWGADRALRVPAAVVAAVLVPVAVLRRRGRPALEWCAVALALRARLRAARGPWSAEGADPVLAPLLECAGALRTSTYRDRRRERDIGMVGDGTFLTALLLVRPGDEPLRAAREARALELGLLYEALEVDGVRLESAQVVQHTRPAPGPGLAEGAPAARSYASLRVWAGAPAVRLTWIALRLDPGLCPDAVRARGGGLGGAQRALLRAADQVAGRLAAAGFDARLLTEAQVVSALAASAGVTVPAGPPQAGPTASARRTAESRRAWRCDDRWHTTYGVGRRPRPGAGAADAAGAVALLVSEAAPVGTFSLTVSRGTGGAPAVSGHVRLTACDARELAGAARRLERAARGAGVGLVRLDREQLPGVLATLPLGGAR